MSSKVKCNCAYCGNEMLRFASHVIGKKYGVFCNKDCLGLFRSAKLTGTLAANFKTGSVGERGYILALVPWHPKATKQNFIYLHRLIAEAKMGRYLKDDEIVHHIDGNSENNHWDNLQVMTQSEHAKEHFLDGTIEFNYITKRFQKGTKNGTNAT